MSTGSNQEDKGVPNWLVFVFFGTMVLGVVYAVFMHGFLGQSTASVLRASSNQQYIVGEVSKIPRTPEAITQGGQLAGQVCSSCHMAGLVGGDGAQGPNLMDAVWLQGTNSETTLYNLIVKGVAGPEKKSKYPGNMPARGNLSNNADVWRVVYWMSSVNRSIKKDAD